MNRWPSRYRLVQSQIMSGFCGSVAPVGLLVTAKILKYLEWPSQKVMMVPILCRTPMLRKRLAGLTELKAWEPLTFSVKGLKDTSNINTVEEGLGKSLSF